MPDVLLVTGSTGIAAATARLWPGDVFVIGDDPATCAQYPAHAIADVRDEQAVEAAVAACMERFGAIDAVFNAAGLSARRFGDGPLHECSAEAWDVALDVNAKGTFLVCRAVLRRWIDAGARGAILNMGSVLARHPEPQRFATAAYAASKGAVESMTLAAAAYYADRGIRLNVIAPGLVRTPMSARAQADPEIQAFIARKQPLAGGMISAEDVARTAVFLLQRESSPMTGQIVTLDGGWSIL